MASQKQVAERLRQITSRLDDLQRERDHLISIYKANRRAQIAETCKIPPLDEFLTQQEWADIQKREAVALGNAEIDRQAALVRPLA